MHPAPGVHNLAAGCTHFGTCAPRECTLFQSISIHYIDLNIYGKFAGCMILSPSTPVYAQNKCLILSTDIGLEWLKFRADIGPDHNI